jgi:ribose-phosphate pyrophosphokinase
LADDAALLLAFPDYVVQSQRLAAAAGIACEQIELHHFPDGESLVRLPPDLPPHVIFCRSLDRPNEKLIELELAAAAARGLGARRLTLVSPYLCYMRQDRSFRAGEAVSQQIVGRLLAQRFDELITVDPHLHRTHELGAAVPVRRAVALSAAPVMADWLTALDVPPLLMGPDEESRQWVGSIAGRAGLDYGVATKVRLGDRRVRVELPDIGVRERDVVLVDDVASTGRTLAECAAQLLSAGARSVAALVTHALFVDDALDAMRHAGIEMIVSTDSIAHPSNALPLAPLLARAVTG